MFTCNVCSKDVHADDRAAHYCTHLKKELVPFICPECKLRAISRPAFERHLRYSHERSRNWNELREKAFNCNQTYNWEESFSKKGVSLNLSNDPHCPQGGHMPHFHFKATHYTERGTPLQKKEMAEKVKVVDNCGKRYAALLFKLLNGENNIDEYHLQDLAQKQAKEIKQMRDEFQKGK